MINILPKKEKSNLEHEYITRLIIVVLIFISCFSVAVLLLLIPSYKYSVSKELVAENNLENFNNKNPEINVNKLNDEISATNDRLDFLVAKKPKYSVSESVIDSLLSVRTPGISFTQINYMNRSDGAAPIQIIGKARDRSALHTFNDSILKNSTFSSVDLPISNFVKPTNIDYSLSVYLK